MVINIVANTGTKKQHPHAVAMATAKRIKIVSKTGIGVIISESGEMLHDDAAKSECFNAFFSSVFTRDNGVIPDVSIKGEPGSFTDIASSSSSSLSCSSSFL